MLAQKEKNKELIWPSSLIGIAGNVKADQLVDNKTKTILNPTINNIPTNDIKISFRKEILKP